MVKRNDEGGEVRVVNRFLQTKAVLSHNINR